MRLRLLLAALFVACGDSQAPPDAMPARTQVALVPETANRDLDMLFVIDDSTNFLATQLAFTTGFQALVDELSTLDGGLPSLHIGVVSGDIGTLGTLDAQPGPSIGSGVGSCSGSGNNGALLTNGAPVTDAYLSDVATADGSRLVNYTGSLPDVFKQVATLGSGGCAFQQHLAAMRRALDPGAQAAGFLRPSAHLAVIVLTDDDDCTFMHSGFTDPNDPSLGRLGTFRCTQFGVTCNEDITQPGVKTGCHSNETSAYLPPLGEYETFLRQVKPDPRDVLFGVVAGPGPVQVELSMMYPQTTPAPKLKLACIALDGINPATRLPELATSLPRGFIESDCTTDLRPAQARLGRHLRNLVGDTCLPDLIAPAADCIVVEQRADGSETELPMCEAPGDCYRLILDSSCTASALRLSVRRSSPAAAGSMFSVRCTTP